MHHLAVLLSLGLLCLTLDQKVGLNINNTVVYTNRSTYRTNMCVGCFNISQEAKTTGETLLAYYKNQYSGGTFVQKVIQNQLNSSTIQLQDISPILVHSLPHGICLLVLLLIWPCLCCCCACPCSHQGYAEKHPACECCRKKHKEMYTRLELKWTSYILVLATIVAMAGSLGGLLKGTEVTAHYNNTACRMVAALDDLQNGRVSDDGETFFVGLNPLADQLLSFNSKLNTFYTQSQNCFTGANTIKPDGNTILTQVAGQYSGFTNDVYSNAFTLSDGATYVNVNSQFKNMYLGPTSNINTVTGLMNAQLTMFFNLINNALDPMLTSWAYLNTTNNQAAVSTLLTTQAANISNITKLIDGNITTLAAQFWLSDQMDRIKVSLGALYGLILSLSIILFVCAVGIACWSVVRVRLVIYLICGILIVLGVVSFAALVITAVLIPIGAQSCLYLDAQLATPASAQQLLTNLGMPQVGAMINPCLGGDNNIVKQVSQQLSDTLDNVVTISTNTQSFSTLIGQYSTANVQAVFTNARGIIISVHNASRLDLNDSVSSNFFTSLATKAFLVGGSCNTTTVGGDCWVPSYTAGTCNSGIGRMSPCSNLGDITVCPLGCYEIQNTFVNPSGDSGYATHLSTRYTAGCSYVDLVKNLHLNYNQIRMITLATQNGTVNTIQSTFTNYDTKVTTLKANLGTFSTNLAANFDFMTNTQTGAFYGTKCQSMKQSVQAFRDALCIGLFGSLQYNLICLALCSWAILFISCCATCTGVRHYNHLRKIQLSMEHSGSRVNISETKIKFEHD